MCEPYSSKKFPEVWEVMDVMNREKILIHKGNIAAHTLGCILVGLGIIPDDNRITDSAKAMELLKKLFKRCEFKLVIVDGPPPTPTPTPTPTPKPTPKKKARSQKN
jgi:hypothetical protein